MQSLLSLRGGPSGATLVKYCYVDAASLNTAKDLSSLEGHAHPSSRRLAHALASLYLDVTMNRNPPSLKWADHAAWPRREGEDGKTKRSRRSQKDWQAETKWKWKIVALTLPTLGAPTVISAGRRNATMGWLSGFEIQPGDATEFG